MTVPFSRSQKGFSLVDVMIALAVVSGLGLIVAGFSSSATKMLTGVDKNNIIADTMTEISLALEVPGACTQNLGAGFGNGVVNVSDPINGAQLQKISSYLPDKTEARKILERTKSFQAITVTDLRLIPVVKLSDALVLTELQATFEHSGGGPHVLIRKLPILARVQQNVVQECWLKRDYQQVGFNQICDITSNGAVNTVDENGKCTLANGRWFKGTPTEAKCPIIGRLPVAANNRENCRMKRPAGFVDSFQTQTVILNNGETQKMGRDPYRLVLDKDNKRCLCDWAEDINPSEYATAECEILCLVP